MKETNGLTYRETDAGRQPDCLKPSAEALQQSKLTIAEVAPIHCSCSLYHSLSTSRMKKIIGRYDYLDLVMLPITTSIFVQ